MLGFLGSSNPKYEGESSWIEDGDAMAGVTSSEGKLRCKTLATINPQHVGLHLNGSSSPYLDLLARDEQSRTCPICITSTQSRGTVGFHATSFSLAVSSQSPRSLLAAFDNAYEIEFISAHSPSSDASKSISNAAKTYLLPPRPIPFPVGTALFLLNGDQAMNLVRSISHGHGIVYQ